MSKILLAIRAWLLVGYVEYASGLCMEVNTKWIWKENWVIVVDSAESKNAMGRSGSTIGSRCSIFCHLLDYFRASKLIISMLCWTKFWCIEIMPFDVEWHFVIMRFLTKFVVVQVRCHLLEVAGPEPNVSSVLGANFAAGVLAGGLAAAATCPLDVAKTRRQIEVCVSSHS